MTAGLKPYYDDGQCVIYHGDCREILNEGWKFVDLVLTDPPYGIDYTSGSGRKIHGDDEPFDPRPLLKYGRCVIWGADNFAHLLPASRGWIVWAKIQEQSMIDGRSRMASAPVELAWSNVASNPELFNHYWAGGLPYRASERNLQYHPAQKPVALMVWILNRWTKPGDLILDPYMGSGPVLRAAKDCGRRAVGIEIEERYCEIAANRLRQEVLPLEAV